MAREIDLIAAIYDAAIDPSGWDDVVRRLVEATRSIAGGISLYGDGIQLTALCNIDPSFAEGYARHYHKMNPLEKHSSLMAPGQIATTTRITQTDSFRASPYYNEFLRPQGWADFVSIGLRRAAYKSGSLTLLRSADAVWVEPPQWQLLEALAPHLARAANIDEMLSRARAATQSLGSAIGEAGFAAFLLTEDSRVLFANAKAEDLIRSGKALRYERGRLAAPAPALTHRLQALAREGARPACAEGGIGGTIELPCGVNRAPLFAHVIPLAANRVVSIFDLCRPAAAVFVVDPQSNLNAQIRRFAARFGLTPGETRVLAEIICGHGLQAAAVRLKISRATARTHADNIFAKTGTNRQTELIRRFFEASMPSQPGGA